MIFILTTVYYLHSVKSYICLNFYLKVKFQRRLGASRGAGGGGGQRTLGSSKYLELLYSIGKELKDS